MPEVTSPTAAPVPQEQSKELYQWMLGRYSESGESVPVDFRELVPEVAATERATHMLHPYPAKLLRHIPAFAVSAPQLCPPEGTVFDPFCGSGTTLVEAFLAGRSAIGVDVNPLAALISKVKTTPIEGGNARAELQDVISAAEDKNPAQFRSHARLKYWYPPQTLKDLSRAQQAISEVCDPAIRDLFLVALSATSRELSLANPRISVPVRLRPEAYKSSSDLYRRLSQRLKSVMTADALSVFCANGLQAIDRVETLGGPHDNLSVQVVATDTRDLSALKSTAVAACSVDLILTSPPYLGAQKYIRATSLNQLCIDLVTETDLSSLQELSIGREHFRKAEYERELHAEVSEADSLIAACRKVNPLRAHLAARYLLDMADALSSATRYLRTGGCFILIAGGNRLCGAEFDTPRYLRSLCESLGLVIETEVTDTIRSRGLMTRRNREASPIATERVMVFRK